MRPNKPLLSLINLSRVADGKSRTICSTSTTSHVILKGQGGSTLLRQDSSPSLGSGGMFGNILRDPETVLLLPTTTRIQDRCSRAGTARTRLFSLLMTSLCAQSRMTPAVCAQSLMFPLFPESHLRENKAINTVPLNSDPLLHCIRI